MTPSPVSFAPVAEPDHMRAMRPIDLVHLARQCLGDENLEQEILRLFDSTVQSYFARVEAANTRDDVVLCLHSIRGAAGGVGAWAIASLAEAAEVEMATGRPLSAQRVADLSVAVAAARAFIARMLSNEPA